MDDGGFELVDQRIDEGDDDEREEGGGGEAEDDCEGHGGTDFCAVAESEGHGDEAEDGGGGGEEDGSEADRAGLDDGFAGREAALFEGVGVVDEDDGVIDDDTGEEDEAEEDDDGEVDTAGGEAEDTAEEGEGNTEHDDEGLEEGFELGGHDDIDEEEAEAEGEVEAAFTAFPFLVLTGDAVAEVGGPGDLAVERFLDMADGAAEGAFAEVGLDEGDSLSVDPADFAGAFTDAEVGDGVEGDGLVGAGVHDEAADIVEVLAVGFIEADHDGDASVLEVKAGGFEAFDHIADLGGDRLDIETIDGEAVAVVGDLDFGCAAALGGFDVGEAG
ncbi:MAG: hypothetical protein RI897_2489 [Verrucomicrobiota bacterium]